MLGSSSNQDRRSPRPTVSIVIPHYRGDVVAACLRSVQAARSRSTYEVIVVDDQPFDDGSIAHARATCPGLRVAKSGGGAGFGAACNAGIAIARGQYLAILNNDVEVAPGWLDELVAAAEREPTVAVFQAKLRSIKNRTRFDYSGAAGGLIDCLGYPFALGRLFEDIEEDRGQYDRPRDIFWAVGGAMLIRRSCIDVVGGFDPAFYMHMEEMDLCWRMQLAGFRIRSCPSAVVYHHNGFTLRSGSFKKTWLNHRNNWVLLLKNLPVRRLLWVVPCRLAIELGTVVYGATRRDWKHPTAALLGVLWVILHLLSIAARRRDARRVRRAPDGEVLARMAKTCVVIDHFVRGRRIAEVLERTCPPLSTRLSSPLRPASRSSARARERNALHEKTQSR